MTRACVIGNFDGVHRGHRALLDAGRAAAPDGDLVVVTFWPHPMSVVRPDKAPKLLCDLDERVRRLQAAGADEVHVVDFTPELARETPAEFVERTLVPLNLDHVVVGENFRFGFRASGDVGALTALGREHGFGVTGLPLVKVADEETCSTAVRRALAAGDLASAEEQLGHRFAFRGVVVHGAQRGRTLGFPTANLLVPDWMAAPADGVYAGWARLDEPGAEEWPAAISVGTNPTFDDVPRTVESYVLDRTDLDLYDRDLRVEFVSRLRGMVKFDGLEPLIAQMHTDVDDARAVLAAHPPERLR